MKKTAKKAPKSLRIRSKHAPGKHYLEAEKREIVGEYLSSSLPAKQYCARRRLNLNTLYRWIRNYFSEGHE
jgi:transposase-like protein